ncbi:MAG: HDOD domain-containing protein [Deltaproteobacteria bacterium]|nr:HDOD domain-containing protein [Deltaproteobacteria bacterium]
MEILGRGKKKGEEGYGQGRAAIAEGDDVLLDEEALSAELLACLEAPSYRPPVLPAVAIEVMALAQKPDVAIKDVITLLERDALIAGRVLKVACSPVYARGAKVGSLKDATMRLGLQTIRDLVMQITLEMRVFKSADYASTMELLRRHATVTARLCRVVSKYTALEAEFSFMAGLLHDVGIAGTLLALAERKGKRKTAPDLIAIWPAVDRVHQRAGELMAKHWTLPPDIAFTLGAHHQVLIQGYPHPLAATVAIANDLAAELGAGVVPKTGDGADEGRACLVAHSEVDRTSPHTLAQAREALRLSDATLALIRKDAERAVAEEDEAAR